MNYKVVLGFVAGLLTGAAATFFITKKIHEDEIEQLKDQVQKSASEHALLQEELEKRKRG